MIDDLIGDIRHAKQHDPQQFRVLDQQKILELLERLAVEIRDHQNTTTMLLKAADMLEHWPLTQTTAERAAFAQHLRNHATQSDSKESP